MAHLAFLDACCLARPRAKPKSLVNVDNEVGGNTVARPKNVVNEADLEWQDTGRGGRTAAKRKRVGVASGLEKLGASIIEVAPGKRAFPRHWHAANEEFLYVISGTGTLKLGKEDAPLRAGDFVALPAGEGHVHEVSNDGTVPLRYLAASTNLAPDIAHFPDSQKLLALDGVGADGRLRVAVFPDSAAVDYWTGED